jgi:hypothetical protein
MSISRLQPRRGRVLHRCDAALLLHVQASQQGSLSAGGAANAES